MSHLVLAEPRHRSAGRYGLQATTYVPDTSRSLLAPDAGRAGAEGLRCTPYRGAGGSHAAEAPWPSNPHQILVHLDAPLLLRARIGGAGWRPRTLALRGPIDPYPPIERRLRLTRRCLDVLAEMRHPVEIVTGSPAVIRDLEVLRTLAAHDCVRVCMQVATLDARLAAALDPLGAPPAPRLHAIHQLAAAGIPVGVEVAPVLPGGTDDELPALLQTAAEAGARCAAYVPARVTRAQKQAFADWLRRHLPRARRAILQRVRVGTQGRGRPAPRGSRLRAHDVYAQALQDRFRSACGRAGLQVLGSRGAVARLSTRAFRRTREAQLDLFQEAAS